MAAANAVLDHYIKNREEILRNVREMGSYAMKRLKELEERHRIIGEVRGKGLMIGIELVKDRESKAPGKQETARVVFDEALKRGLLLATSGWYGNVIRFAPPLTVKREEIDKAVEILDESLAQVEG